MHEEKDERLEVKEGAGLDSVEAPSERALTVEALEPGAEFHLEPGSGALPDRNRKPARL